MSLSSTNSRHAHASVADRPRTKCDLCGSSEKVVVGRWGRYFRRLTNVMCTRCGLVRQEPMPSEAELRAFYKLEYRQQYKGTAMPRARDIKRDRGHAERRLSLIETMLHPGARILEIGSGSGTFLKLARERGYAVQGIELDAEYAAPGVVQSDLPVHLGSWSSAPFVPGAFDLVAMHQVLEHLPSPSAVLRRVHEWTSENGLLYVSVPNIHNADASPFNRFHRAHLYSFSPETITMMARKAGFVPLTLPSSLYGCWVFRRSSTAPPDRIENPEHAKELLEFLRKNRVIDYLMRPAAYRRLFWKALGRGY